MFSGGNMTKHGTTTVGITFKDGVVLAADKRASLGYMVAHKVAEKIIPITDKIALTIAGMVGDAQMLAKYLKAELEVYRLRSGREPSVKTAAGILSSILFENRAIPFYVQLILGGVDEKPHLFALDPDGGVIEDKYIATGSGSVFALGLLEAEFKENMKEEDATRLAVKAVNVALKRDVFSGDGIDCVVITKKGIKRLSKKEIEEVLKGR